MGADEFARRLRQYESDSGKRFAFFLGAGCSRSSGIPLAGELVRDRWLPRLRDFEAPHRNDLEAWAIEILPAYDPKTPGGSYGELINRLFITAEDRQQEIESLCDGRSPGFGYAVLARLIARPSGQFNVVLTTNFDDMVGDALYLYTAARPLVIHHESLAAYIRPTRTRPLVVKLHGDHRLSPRNTRLETTELETEISHHTAMVLHDRGLIFMGYGGNDESINRLLKSLPRTALPHGVYWIDKNPPSGAMLQWLRERGAVWVTGGYFDEVMLLVRNAFDLPHPDPSVFTKIFEGYHKTFQTLSGDIEKKAARAPDTLNLKEAVKKVEASFSDAWHVISAAARLQKSAPEEAALIYRNGIDQFPMSAPLLGSYADFLSDERKDYDTAEEFYKRAIDAEPTNAVVLGNYGAFCSTVRKDHDKAEELYKCAIELDPTHNSALMNYATLLWQERNDHDTAEEFYRRSIEADAGFSTALDNYAFFLLQVRKDHDKAEEFYKRAIDADPEDVSPLTNYAIFLSTIRRDHVKAEEFHKRAIAVDPGSAFSLSGYASFLSGIQKNYDKAEEFHKRAIDADPKHAQALSNYAALLAYVRKEHDKAEEFYKRAIDADPNYKLASAIYAIFLVDIRKDYDRAEEFYKRAIDGDSFTLGAYAIFLANFRNSYDKAEDFYRRAIEASPENINNIANYAGMLLALGRQTDGIGMLDRALEAPGASLVERVECWFYALAHRAPERRSEALKQLKRLITSDGARSPGWDFSRNVERARADGHPDAAWLALLADVICEKADSATLEAWPAWATA